MTSKLIFGIRSKKIPVQQRGIKKLVFVRVKNPLEDLVYAIGHDPNDRWCSCSMCCCANGMCTHWDDL